jgi:hypothetical protein
MMLEKTFEVITCEKNPNNGYVIGCNKSIPSTTVFANITSCKPVTVAFPIEMNTVFGSNAIIKTIEGQKEVYLCTTFTNTQVVKDATIFTEIFENLSQGRVKKGFESTTCIKILSNANVTSCKASKTISL